MVSYLICALSHKYKENGADRHGERERERKRERERERAKANQNIVFQHFVKNFLF